jgi:type II secretory pathway predicted ATPase ExeA
VYNSYFGFSQSPFENNLDQRFLFLGEDHQEVLAALMYFIETKKGFAMFCGDVGTGKTMLINSFLNRLPETIKPIIISNPYVSSLDLLFCLAKTLKTKTTGGENVLELTDKIKNALVKAKSQDKHLILIIDEAHLLSDQVLEGIRLLSNIETPDQKLLQILLVGQYELSHKLDRPEMRHLRQRININRFLSHLNFSETIQYIDHRLQQVGSSFASVFKDNCKAPIFKVTKGVPRLINQLCDNALLISMNEGLRKVNRKTLKKAAEALQTDRVFTPPSALRKESSRLGKYFKILAPVGAGLVLGLIGIIALIMPGKFQPISHVIESIGQVLPQIKARPKPTEIKETRTPSTEKALITPEETKLPQTTPPQGPQPDLEKGQPAITPPIPEPKITPTPIKGAAEGAPEVKQEAAPSPRMPEEVKKEGKQEERPPPGTTPENKEPVDSKAYESPSVQLKPGGETPVTEPLPAPPAFEQFVARGGESLTRIAAQHYPKDPRFSIAAMILQNPHVTKVDVIKSGEILYFPKINFENRTIQLKDNLWYAFYGRYPSPERANQIASWLTTKEIKSLVRDIKSGGGITIKRIFIGGYATEEELTQALNSLTTKKK